MQVARSSRKSPRDDDDDDYDDHDKDDDSAQHSGTVTGPVPEESACVRLFANSTIRLQHRTSISSRVAVYLVIYVRAYVTHAYMWTGTRIEVAHRQ